MDAETEEGYISDSSDEETDSQSEANHDMSSRINRMKISKSERIQIGHTYQVENMNIGFHSKEEALKMVAHFDPEKINLIVSDGELPGVAKKVQIESNSTPKESEDSRSSKGTNPSKNKSSNRPTESIPVLGSSSESLGFGSSAESTVSGSIGYNLDNATHLETDSYGGNDSMPKSTNPFLSHHPTQDNQMLITREDAPVLGKSNTRPKGASGYKLVDEEQLETDSYERKSPFPNNFNIRDSVDSNYSDPKSSNPFLYHSTIQNNKMFMHQAAQPDFSNDLQSNRKGRAVLYPDNTSTMQNPKNRVQNERFQSQGTDPALQLLPKCYIENSGFRLGVEDCRHFEGAFGVIVEVQNGKNFIIILGNLNPRRCNVDVHVNGKLVAEIQLHEEQAYFKLHGPILIGEDNRKKFVFLRSRDAPSEAGIDIHCPNNGVVEAHFMPEKEKMQETERPVTRNIIEAMGQIISEGIQDQKSANKNHKVTPAGQLFSSMGFSHQLSEMDNVRSVAQQPFCGGAVALQESTEKRNYDLAENIEIDKDKSVILRLRMVARMDDESKPNPREIITPLYESAVPPPFQI